MTPYQFEVWKRRNKRKEAQQDKQLAFIHCFTEELKNAYVSAEKLTNGLKS